MFNSVAHDGKGAHKEGMVDFFSSWLPQIIGFAKMIDDGSLQREWEGDRSFTSADDKGEPDVNSLGDLNPQEMKMEMREHLAGYPALFAAAEAFLEALDKLDVAIGGTPERSSWGIHKASGPTVLHILASAEWHHVQTAATAVLAAAELDGLGICDFERPSWDPGRT